MSEEQEPYGDTQDHELPNPGAPEPEEQSMAQLLVEIMPDIELGRKDLVEIAMGLTGEVDPIGFHTAAMRLRSIADVFSTAAHLDMMHTCETLIAQRDEAKAQGAIAS